MERFNEETTVPFWRDVIFALQKLWKSNMIIKKVLHTPIWDNPELRLQTIPEWNKEKASVQYGMW